jgi:glucoamylase
MRAQASDGGMIPEQVWDAEDIPERELANGRPTGGAMPLVWAHAEYLKLVRSLRDGRVFDRPPQPYERYVRRHTPARVAIWCFGNKVRTMAAGQTLRVQATSPVRVHWSADGWRTTQDVDARDVGLGLYAADLATGALAPGAEVRFTLYWPEDARWQGEDYTVLIMPAPAPSAPPRLVRAAAAAGAR